jgi:hypothetical protein
MRTQLPPQPPADWRAQAACGAGLVTASTALLVGAGAGVLALLRGTASADDTAYALLAGPLSMAGSLIFLYLAWLARELHKAG